MMKRIEDMIVTTNAILLGWITISTLQVMLRIGTVQAWNFWQVVVDLMK